jgi:anti-anti-sigma factor
LPPWPGCASVLFELAASDQPLIADLDRVSFIDSAGLAALVGAARRAAAHGASLHVICTRPQTRQLFRLTGLDRQIPLARTLDEALESAAAPGTPASGPRQQPSIWPMISAASMIASLRYGPGTPAATASRKVGACCLASSARGLEQCGDLGEGFGTGYGRIAA